MSCLDTGTCVPESNATLAIQQDQLKRGKRCVQMFPLGTDELPLPTGFARLETNRGIFHYDDKVISEGKIRALSSHGKENVFLNLGPFCKAEIAERIQDGEKLTFVTEYAPGNVEVRCAAGTNKTSDFQREFFERTKDAGNVIVVGMPPERVLSHIMKG